MKFEMSCIRCCVTRMSQDLIPSHQSALALTLGLCHVVQRQSLYNGGVFL